MKLTLIFPLATLAGLSAAACLPSGDATTINIALQSGGAGAIVQLCPGAVISVTTAGIAFTAENQELSTQGYPTDSTRATVIIEPGSSITSAIWGRWTSGVKVLNLQVDGNRPSAGLLGGDALIEMGGGAAGQVVSHCVVKNTRSWSCLHYIGSGQDENPCREGTVTYNTIGPCGNEGTDDDGHSRWADGVSFECVNSEVSYNDISGTTDGAIVIFGAPGSHFISNTITSSETDLGFGAFNMVDPTYAGNYSGVVVSGNTIKGVGTGFFNLGVGIGNNVWSNPNDLTYFGPATITDNTFIGNIGFSVVVNGWSEGLTITGNDVSQVTTPSTAFADASNCQPQVKTSLADNEQLIVYLPSVTGPLSLQPDFTDVPDNATIWMCLQHPVPPLPSTQSFSAGSLTVTAAQTTVVDLENFHVQLQAGDGNLVGYSIDPVSGAWTPAWASSFQTANCDVNPELCEVTFGADGDFVEATAAGSFWHTNTAGRGQTIVFSNAAPYLEILDGTGASVWTIASGLTLY